MAIDPVCDRTRSAVHSATLPDVSVTMVTYAVTGQHCHSHLITGTKLISLNPVLNDTQGQSNQT